MAALTLRQDGRTHVEDHSNPGFRAVFPRCSGDVGGRHPMVDHAVGISATLLSRRSDTLRWARVHYCRRARIVDSFARFALQGLGTPAPIAPPRNLVVSGLYRYVRNPIYVAVVAVILGQAVLFADWHLLGYGALIWLFFHIFVIAYEEPTLRQSFGAEYESYCGNVPRWLPRLTPRAV